MERPQAFEVDPVSLSLADKDQLRYRALVPVNSLPLFGGIRGAAPDAWGRRVIEAKFKASSTAPTELHAMVELTASGGADRAEEIWFGNARVSTTADLVVTPTRPADLGLAVDLTLTCRFDGSLVQTGTDVQA